MTVPFTKFEGLYIDNRWVPVQDSVSVINPATEAEIGQAPEGGVHEAEAAIASAREAFDTGPWPRMTQVERTTIMRRMLDALVARKPEIRALILAEVGCSQGVTDSVQIGAPLDHFEQALQDSLKDPTYHLPNEFVQNPGNPDGPRIFGGGVVVREPVGVVAGITAYNYPFVLNLSKIVPALLTGNTLVLKPSPFTPFSALMFGEIASEIGLPPGVLNIVTGGPAVGTMLTSDPRIDMVTFTGSEGVGAAIMAQAAPTLKRVHLELGGKSALIVRADADIQAAAMTAIGTISFNCGQGCALTTRILVHNSIRAALVAAMSQVADHFKVGDPTDPSVLMGPLIREAQRSKVEHYVELGLQSGARLVRGGTRPANLPKGFFYDLTIFDDVDNSAQIAQDEIFGPVLVVSGFDTDEEAIRIANDSRYGLAGGIMSADAATAFEMAMQVRTGSMMVNGGIGKWGYGPIGGYKRSGIGREYGPHWLNEFTQEKSVFYPIGR